MLTVKKWLDIDITDTDAIIAPSVFSQAHKIKKSAQASLALPPAENMVNLWDFKEYEASGISKDQDHMTNKSSRKNPLARGHFYVITLRRGRPRPREQLLLQNYKA